MTQFSVNPRGGSEHLPGDVFAVGHDTLGRTAPFEDAEAMHSTDIVPYDPVEAHLSQVLGSTAMSTGDIMTFIARLEHQRQAIQQRNHIHALEARETATRKEVLDLQEFKRIDQLTLLLSRSGFMDEVLQEIREAEKRSGHSERRLEDTTPGFAVLMLDLDNFKGINDTHGHLIGDEVLRIFGDVLQRSTRDHDEIGRFGGDEFFILLRDFDVKDIDVVKDKIRSKLEFYKEVEGCKVKIGTSIGFAQYEDGDSEEDLIRRADLSLYEDKEGKSKR